MSRTRSATAGLAGVVLAGALVISNGQREPDPPAGTGLTRSTQLFWDTYRTASRSRAATAYDAAIAGYLRALEIKPNHEDSLYYLGNCYLERRDYAQALDAYRRLLAVNPQGSTRAYIQIALVHASLDPTAPFDLAESEQLFTRALALDPDSGALLGLAEVAMLRSDWSSARTRLLRVEADNPMSIAAPYLLGFLSFRDGERAAAWQWFTTAIGRGELKKATVQWTEEGDVKADPALRWRALARQSVFGAQWMRLRVYLRPPGPTAADMLREYRQLAREMTVVRARLLRDR